MKPRLVQVSRSEPPSALSVLITLCPEEGGSVTELRMSESEMVELAKALDLMCSDSGLFQVSRKAPRGAL